MTSGRSQLLTGEVLLHLGQALLGEFLSISGSENPQLY